PNRWAMASFKGRPFFRLTVCKGDKELPGALPAPNVAVHQGWSDEYAPPLHEQVQMHWSLGIPEDWTITPNQWVVMPPNIHSVNLGPSPFSCWIVGNVLRFAISVDDPNGKPIDSVDDIWMVGVTDIPFTPGDVFDFDLYWISSGQSDGYCVLWCNGKQVMQYNGPTLCTKEACVVNPEDKQIPYVNHMLYVFGKDEAEAWPTVTFANGETTQIQARELYYLPWALN
ncbi:MAG: hypothetical protein ACYDB1_13650, partial [Acidiferrobacteraceae bacterium]